MRIVGTNRDTISIVTAIRDDIHERCASMEAESVEMRRVAICIQGLAEMLKTDHNLLPMCWCRPGCGVDSLVIVLTKCYSELSLHLQMYCHSRTFTLPPRTYSS
uniref:Uncharacterized protein n=1 Tax=viral metagenome TaxID=1070528 RepID=A0A6C0LXJ0_9ZZZZ